MESPEKFGDFQLHSELKKGASSTTYKGFTEAQNRFVALKVLQPEMGRSDRTARFEQEARKASFVRHPNLTAVLSIGRENGQVYVASEFAEGIDLGALISLGRVPSELAAYIIQEVAQGLKAAHEKSVLHGDVNPSNVTITRDGRVKLTGMGVSAALPDDEETAVAYRAPEVEAGEAITETSDLFALGAVLFEMMAGERAFQGESVDELKESVAQYDPMPLLMDDDTIPSQLRRICQQMLKKKPAQRYHDYSVLLSDLDAFQKARGSAAVAASPDLKNYLDDPESYKKRRRDTPELVLRERSVSPRSTRPDERTPVQKTRPSSSHEIDVKRLLTTVALIVVVFAGLSFAGSFFFSKDGQFGARNNPAGSRRPTPAKSEGSTAVAGRGQQPSGGGAVQSSGDAPEGAETPAVPNLNDAPLVVVHEENRNREESEPAQLPQFTPRPATAAPDTLIIIDEPGEVTGRIRIDVSPWAYVYVDGDSLGVTPMPVIAKPGTYTVTLRHPDFPPLQTVVDVAPNLETPVYVSLWAFVGLLELDALPGARVFIDGEYRAETPLSQPLLVKPGKRELSLVHPEKGRLDTTIEVTGGESKVFAVDSLQ